MRMHPRRILVVGLFAVGAAAVFAPAAVAHIDPDPSAVPVGETATVGFTVEHGCDGSPTVSVAIQIPSGITDARPVELAGWTGTAAGQVVTFAGGPLDPATAQTFSITFTAPTASGDARFPIIQTCQVGEIAWLDQEVEGQPEPETPAPTVHILGPGQTAESAATEPTVDNTATVVVATAESAAPVATVSSDSSNTAPIVGIAVGAALVAVIAAVVLRRRSAGGTATGR